jgi:uncharacterized protein (TIGR02246 family)
MKKTFYIMLLAVMIITACQTKQGPVDTTAAKEAVTNLLNKWNSTWNAKDANSMMTLLDNNGLYCGTDSKELMDKPSMSNMMSQFFADTSIVPNYSIDKREIRVAVDGNSAIALEQAILKAISPKIPVRFIFHLVKTGDNWMIDFFSGSFIPNNEDLGKLNKALE